MTEFNLTQLRAVALQPAEPGVLRRAAAPLAGPARVGLVRLDGLPGGLPLRRGALPARHDRVEREVGRKHSRAGGFSEPSVFETLL